MFDIGFSELLVIALVGLIVLGPKRLPEVARTAGRWLGRVRRFVADVKQDIDREMQLAELAELRNLKQELDDTRRMMEETSSRLLQEANIASVEPSARQDPPAAAPAAAPATPNAEPPMEIPAGLVGPPPGAKRTPKRRKKAAASKAAAPKPANE